MRTLSTMVLAVAVLATGMVASAQDSDSRFSNDGRYLVNPNYDANAAEQPSAAGDTDSSCQEPDQAGAGGILAVTSDIEAGFLAADNFRFLTPGEVTQIDWWGLWIDPPPDAFEDCSPFGVNNFRVRILGDNNGVPDNDNIITVLTQADGNLTNAPTGALIGGFPEIQWTFVPTTPIELPLDEYWLEVANEAADGTTCFFFWEAVSGFDESSAGEDDGDGVYDPDEVGPAPPAENDFDLSYCLTFESSGAQQVVPGAEIFLTDVSDPETGCCNYGVVVENRNTPAPGFQIEEFYVAISKGDGASDCEDITLVTPPPGFDVEFCEPWDSGLVVYRFFGGFLEPQDETFFRVSAGRNGEEDTSVMARVVVGEDIVTEEQTIFAQGVRAWASQSDPAGACGSGNFSPLGTIGDWSRGEDSICRIEPIPAMGQTTKIALACLFVGMGFVLVMRSRQTA